MDKSYNFGNNGDSWSAEHRQNLVDALLCYYDNSYPHFEPLGALCWIMTQKHIGDKRSPSIMKEINECIELCPIPFGRVMKVPKDKLFCIKSWTSKSDIYYLFPTEQSGHEYEEKRGVVNEIINSGVFTTKDTYVKSSIAFKKVNDGKRFTHCFIYPIDLNADYARIFLDMFSHNEVMVKEDCLSFYERNQINIKRIAQKKEGINNEPGLYRISDKTSEVHLEGFVKAIAFYLFDFLLAKTIAGIRKEELNYETIARINNEVLNNEETVVEISKEELKSFIDKFSLFSMHTGYCCSIFKEENISLKSMVLCGSESIKSFKKILEILNSFDENQNTILIPEYEIWLSRVFEVYCYHIIKEKYEKKGHILVEYKGKWPDKDKVVFHPDIIMHFGVKGDIIIDAKCKFDYSIIGAKYQDDDFTIERDIMQLIDYLRAPYSADDPKEGRREICVAYPALGQNNKDHYDFPDIDEKMPDFINFRHKENKNKRIKFLLPIRYPQSSSRWVINVEDRSPLYSFEYERTDPFVGYFIHI